MAHEYLTFASLRGITYYCYRIVILDGDCSVTSPATLYDIALKLYLTPTYIEAYNDRCHSSHLHLSCIPSNNLSVPVCPVGLPVYIISHKIFSILKIVHTRPNVSSRQLPPYSGKLSTTDSLHTRYSTRQQLWTKLHRLYSTLSRHQLRPRGLSARAHFITWRTT